MKTFTRSNRSTQRSKNRRREKRQPLSDARIQWNLHFAYNESKLWVEYLIVYYNLFTDDVEAILRAKTHSMANMCKYLKERYSCSYQRTYENLVLLMRSGEIVPEKSILNVDTPASFIYSLSDLETQGKLAVSGTED